MEQAIKQHDAGKAIIVPIILEPCDWKWLPVNKYQAFLDVIQGIRIVAERLFEQRQQRFKEKKAVMSNLIDPIFLERCQR